VPPVDALLRSQPTGRADYEASGGYRGLRDVLDRPEQARSVLLSTSLTGLGGAHFPFARKAQLALAEPGPRVVVCNAAEDEPGSQKDRTLALVNPHVVVEGALIAAAVLEASDVWFYVSETLPDVLGSFTEAVAEVDPSLRGNVRMHVFPAPAHSVAGEATAVVRAINGGDAKPLAQPPYPTESGVGGHPTLVANCETLANLPRVVRAGWSGGEASGPPTRLATVTGDVVRPGVYEIRPDTDTVADLIALAGGISGSGLLKAVQPGGPSSAFLPAAAAGTLLSNEAIRAAGSQPGCLALRIFSTDRCMVEVVEEIADFFRREQCGQCPPCRMKTQAYHRTVHHVATGNGTWELLDKLSAVDEFVLDMPRRCALIDMPTPPVVSAQHLFREDFAAHIDRQACAAGESPRIPLPGLEPAR